MTPIEVFDIKKYPQISVKLKKVPLAEINQPRQGKIDCLIRFQYAVFHLVYEQAVRHLLLLKNKFRYVTRRSHCQLKEVTQV